MTRAKLLTLLAVGAAVCPAGAQAQLSQDLRSPDARDAAGVGAQARAQNQTVAARNAPGPTASDGFEWGDAAVGAAVILGLGTLAGGTVLLSTRGRQRAPSA